MTHIGIKFMAYMSEPDCLECGERLQPLLRFWIWPLDGFEADGGFFCKCEECGFEQDYRSEVFGLYIGDNSPGGRKAVEK